MRKKHVNTTKSIIENIVKLEELKHGISLKVTSLTKNEYIFGDKEEKLSFLYRVIQYHLAKGYERQGEAFVFIKEVPYRYGLVLSEKETNDITNNMRLSNIKTTLHEIRHILQDNKKELFNDLELFAFTDRFVLTESQVGNYSGYYSELDANLYSHTRLRELYEDRLNNIDYAISKIKYKKNIYDFEKLIEVYSNRVRRTRKKIEGTELFYNRKGEYKNLKNIIEDDRFNPLSPLTIKIITSNDFLSKLDINNLSETEKQLLTSEIDLGIKLLNKNKYDNERMYLNYDIDYIDYYYADDYFKNLIEDKLYYRDLLNKKDKIKSKI